MNEHILIIDDDIKLTDLIKRYLENELRSKYGFFGTSIAMTFKDKDMGS